MKKTLLIAAAALVAGIVSSEAQVYSANVVGYVNVVVPASPGWACAANPFNLDGVNNITNVITGAPKGTTVELFTAAGFSTTIKVSSITGQWGANAATNYLNPGLGFMIQGGSTGFTNTFVGSVLVNTGGTNTLALSPGIFQLVGSPIPYGGTLTNAADTGSGTLNLGASLPKGTSIQTWSSGFSLAAKSSSINGVWNANPTFNAAQGFMVQPGGASTVNWQQTLP